MAQKVAQGSYISTSDHPPAQRRHLIRRLWFPAVLLLSLAAGGMTGIVIAYKLNYSRAANEVAALATYQPSVVTRVYADDGKTIIGEFALERRIPLKYEEIPPVVKNAILAVEDARFYDHVGIDPIRIVGAGLKILTTDKVEGGSTLTQQLAKNLFLSREQTLKRKFNEWVMALQIERFYTKNKIMEMYVNHIFLGARAYGIEAGAETYFGKKAKDLTIEEAALLAGIPKAPSQYSPTANMSEATRRRNLVIDLMAKHEFISQAEAEKAKATPIKLADSAFNPTRSSPYDYPVEAIRQELEEKYTTRIAQGGLTVYSTINAEAQKKAVEAVQKGLRWYDSTHSGWRSTYINIGSTENGGTGTVTPQQLTNYYHPNWYENNYEPGAHVIGLITELDKHLNRAKVRFGSYSATLTAADMGRSRRKPAEEFKLGDLAEFNIKEVDKNNRRLKVELSQIPAVQGALMSINAKNGEVIAMVGGYDFTTNKFNNATQAYRQTGSCFKPFIYTAAVEWGLTPDSPISGAPISKGDWQPHNYDGSTSGPDLPMRSALAQSKNLQAVHLLDMVGIQTGAQMVRRFGITVPMAPYLPSALGATEVPLDQMVSAYGAFPNKGVIVQRHLIRKVLDRDGTVLEEWEKTSYKVTNEYVALTMVSMMRDVVERGTATGAKALGVPIAGKTGTVNDQTDVWFIGYTPTYVTGVWMGYPGRKKSLGKDMTGGRGALPIFVDFMKDFLKGKEKEEFPKPPSMPEDMRQLIKQRQHEIAEELATRAALRDAQESELLNSTLTPSIEMPGVPTSPDGSSNPTSTKPENNSTEETKPKKPEVVTPRSNDDDDTPKETTRPREVAPEKKRGKKGTVGEQ
jgi:penicillin-binding protein 1A